ncbi:MAG: GerW family sporulation protein [Eubacterium sp.]|nr:GerW family sporulation protein [Eubacterium sp.]
MAENNEFQNNVEALFKAMDGFLTTKSVVGEAVQVGDKLMIPLADVTFGLGASANTASTKNNGGGAMGAKISPSALMMIAKDGTVKMISLKNQDTISKILDMAPDLINRFTNRNKTDTPDFEE